MVFQRMRYKAECIESLRVIHERVGGGVFCNQDLNGAINWHHINTLKSYGFLKKVSSRHKIKIATKLGHSGTKEVNQWHITDTGRAYLENHKQEVTA